MKKTALFISAMLIATLLMGGNEKYHQKMAETINKFSTCSRTEDYQELANQFRVIANVENEEWLPLYYEARCYVIMGFMDHLSADVRDNYLVKAEESIEKMKKLAPNEAELYVMIAFNHTGYLLINPPQRAMQTTPLIHAAIGKALTIEPENPRAIFLRISNEMGTASFFGDDITPYCEEARQLLKNWDNYELKSSIYPSWGKSSAEGIVKQCDR